METLQRIVIIWCDISFENEQSYEPMKDNFIETTTATLRPQLDVISMEINDEDTTQIRSNNDTLITVRTIDEAITKIDENINKKTFLISSGTIGRCLIPKVLNTYAHIRHCYVFAHDIELHFDWTDEFTQFVQMFDHPTDLLLRLTRDISSHFINGGEALLKQDEPQYALDCFKHARNLELFANQRDKMGLNTDGSSQKYDNYIEFRGNLNRLDGLIDRAERKIRELEYSVQPEYME